MKTEPFLEEKAGMNESRLVELENGTFHCNARWAMGGMAHRIVSTSVGNTLDKWTTPKSQLDLGKTATVDGGLIRLSHSAIDKKSRILHCKSNDSTVTPGPKNSHRYRNSMTVFMSYD